jgi:hypothetical protein
MIVKAYVRVAKGSRGPKLIATVKPNTTPLEDGNRNPIPTVFFAVQFDVPDESFRRAQQVIAEVKVEDPGIAANVRQIGGAS